MVHRARRTKFRPRGPTSRTQRAVPWTAVARKPGAWPMPAPRATAGLRRRADSRSRQRGPGSPLASACRVRRALRRHWSARAPGATTREARTDRTMRTLHDVDTVCVLRLESCAVDPSLEAGRAPAVGDVCAIVRVLSDHRIVIECVDADGVSAWVAEIDLQDLEAVSSHPRAVVFRPDALETMLKWTELIFGSVGSLLSVWLLHFLFSEPDLGNGGAFIIAISALLLVVSLPSLLAGFCLCSSSPMRWLGQVPLVIAILLLVVWH
jgi:hypothetical protein